MIKFPPFHSALRFFFRFLAITPFNIFIIAIPGLIVFGLLTLAWAAILTLFSIGIAAPVVAFQTELISLSFWMATAVFSTSLFAFFFSVVLSFLFFFITKHFSIYILSYLRWNFNFIFQIKNKV